MRAGPSQTVRRGLLFESMALRDVRVYVDAIGGTTYHYRDSNGLEVDIIAELDDGRWGAIEVKLGENRIEKGAESLARFAQTIEPRPPTGSTSSPSPRSGRGPSIVPDGKGRLLVRREGP
jgi:hypothetical protein